MNFTMHSLVRLLVACIVCGLMLCCCHVCEASEEPGAIKHSPAVTVDARSDDRSDLPSPESDSFLDDANVADSVATIVSPLERPWGNWRARVGALLLSRSNERGYDLSRMTPYSTYFSKSSSLGRSISDSNFVFPIAAGIDTSLRFTGPMADIDIRYFGVLQSTATVGPNGEFFAGVLSEPGASGSFSSALTSSIQSAELNLRREVAPNVALLGGLRYVQFRDALQSEETLVYGGANGWVDVSTYDLRAQNELLGLQLGAEALLWSYADRLRVETSAKAGIFGNAASNRFFEQVQYRGATTPNYWNTYRGNAAFVGDVTISGAYQINRHFALRGGYQLLWLSGVALVTEQANSYHASTYRAFSAGDVLFHGAMVGIECGW